VAESDHCRLQAKAKIYIFCHTCAVNIVEAPQSQPSTAAFSPAADVTSREEGTSEITAHIDVHDRGVTREGHCWKVVAHLASLVAYIP